LPHPSVKQPDANGRTEREETKAPEAGAPVERAFDPSFIAR